MKLHRGAMLLLDVVTDTVRRKNAHTELLYRHIPPYTTFP